MPDKDKDKIIPFAEKVNNRELEVILEVNRKAVEIETEVAGQNEEIISMLNENKTNQERNDEKSDKIIDLLNDVISKLNDLDKTLFKIQVLFITGLLALVAQIIRIFIK